MWRWSRGTTQKQLFKGVFSTYVEVILKLWATTDAISGFLHVCGGDPMLDSTLSQYEKFSPRMWRWSIENEFGISIPEVFSTYVEVILNFCIW